MKIKLFSAEASPRANRAFSLIELMIVIAIIGILTAAIMVNFSSAKAKSRDGKRISDLGNIQLALAQYFDRCRQYPDSSPANSGFAQFDLSTQCPTISNQVVTFGDYIGTIPKDPTNDTTHKYEYAVNHTHNAFILRATLEQNSSVLTDSFDNDNASRFGDQYFNTAPDTNPPLPRITVGPASYECSNTEAVSQKLFVYCLSSKL